MEDSFNRASDFHIHRVYYFLRGSHLSSLFWHRPVTLVTKFIFINRKNEPNSSFRRFIYFLPMLFPFIVYSSFYNMLFSLFTFNKLQ